MAEKISSIDKQTLQEIADSVKGGKLVNTQVGIGIIWEGGKGYNQGFVAASRLGMAQPPDPLGPVTTANRPGNLTNALNQLDATEQKVKSGS